MNPDEIRKLLGGYATGTLTDAERKILFAAALDDQELFDELGREQSLKELLELPGARTRLAAAIAPPAAVHAWWKKPVPWGLAGTLVVAVLVVFVLRRTPQPTEIAGVPQLESRLRLDQPALIPPSKAVLSEPSAAPVPLPKQTNNKVESVRRDTASNGIAAVSPPSPSLQAVPLEQSLKKEQGATIDALGPAADKALADEKDASPSAQAKPQIAQSQGASGYSRQQLSAANRPAPGTPAAPPAALAGVAGSLAPPRFAFDYTLGRDSLIVSPVAPGFLVVTALSASGRQVVLHPASRLEGGSSVNIPVPSGSTTLTVEFSARPSMQDLVTSLSRAEVATGGPAAKNVSKAPVLKEKTGHVEASLTTSDPRLLITLAVPME